MVRLVRCHRRGAVALARVALMRAPHVASAASGLVSLPTSRTTPRLPSSLHRGEAAALVDHLGAFVMDQPGRRLASLRCSVGVAARAMACPTPGSRPLRAWMVTLTYRGTNADWRSDHMSKAMQLLRMWCNRQGFRARYVWVAELQQRGTIHYHAVVWLPVGVRCPAFDSRGWWPHGMTNRKTVRSTAVGYLMKYLSKGTDVDSSSFPKGARIYGVGGLDHAGRRLRRWLRLPAFVKGNSSIWGQWDRAVGGGWTSPDGTRFQSEFVATSIAGHRCLLRVAQHPVAIVASGAFSWITDRCIALLSPPGKFA